MATLMLRLRPQVQVSFRRYFASIPPSESLQSSASQSASPQGPSAQEKSAPHSKSSNHDQSSSQQASSSESDADVNPLLLLLRGHKNNKGAIAALIVAAASADMAFTYTFFNKRKDPQEAQSDIVFVIEDQK
ncbi:hypothetical protein BX616_000595 [Lobosporangium transversale]|nr:hypothetical protein BX616_000595 [Lobosporangium transversale]